MSHVQVTIDAEIIAMLDVADDQVDRVVAESVVLELYRRHDISARRAARLLEMEYLAFLRWSGERGVPYLDLTEEELQAEIQAAKELSASLASRR
ncbi:MAG: UPF0175 family protein [Thermomicrobiales bacterium]